ncbi:MAG TPA: BON domain-containing protein [Solimonas sp.]|nr:BON domain-containing protein [Solimonas sp.]
MFPVALLMAAGIGMGTAAHAGGQVTETEARVDPALTLSAPVRSDASVTEQVRAVMQAEGTLRAQKIQVSTREGVVRLSGTTTSSAQIAQAVALARGVSGVRAVRNELRLKTRTR